MNCYFVLNLLNCSYMGSSNQPDNFTKLINAQFQAGKSVMLGETHESHVKNLNLIADRSQLHQWSRSGLRHIVLELDQSDAELLRKLVDQEVAPDSIAWAMSRRMDASYARIYTNLAVNAHAEGIEIHGGDHQKEIFDGAMHLTAKDRAVLGPVMQRWLRTGSSQAKTLEEKEIIEKFAHAFSKIEEERLSNNGIRASNSDKYITNELSGELRGEVFLGLYGSGHLVGGHGLNALLADATGHPVTTIYIDSSPVLRHQIFDSLLANYQEERLPDYMYNPYRDAVMPLMGGVTTDPACKKTDNWHSDGCYLPQPSLPQHKNDTKTVIRNI
jgi:hypothetical protein